ncbi:MAG: hypothetical protein IJY71_03095 [Clostridia bacterium]|nr:hypothetical protein [Clostridia bacterium]
MDENANRFAEYTRPVAKKGKNRRRRRLLLLGYIVFALFYCLLFTVPVKIPQVIAVLPLFLWILIFYTQRLVSYEIQVSVSGGVLAFAKLWGKKRKECARISLKSILSVERIEKGTLPPLTKGQTVYDFRADGDAEANYLARCRDESGEALYLFEASPQLLSSIRYFNKQAFSAAKDGEKQE